VKQNQIRKAKAHNNLKMELKVVLKEVLKMELKMVIKQLMEHQKNKLLFILAMLLIALNLAFAIKA